MTCSYCGKGPRKIFVDFENRPSDENRYRMIDVTVRHDDLLKAVCSSCDGMYTTIAQRAVLRRQMV